ncbi:Polysialic acid capsule expression protein [Scheffersomyces coipomensis]|uniref:Polysialic acid capsule expression protein n=1 Tax=Scheffersomyces coipomensis TaxID=1788519 RepID=UPI00315C9FD9
MDIDNFDPKFEDLSLIALDSIRNTLRYQNDAVNHLYLQYQTDKFSQTNLLESLQILFKTNYINKGKIVISGIGKSFKIANKLVATLNSLSIHASTLHPSEALHGDLGLIDESKDCLILLTASGNTTELLQLLPHLSSSLPIVLLTCNRNSKLSSHPQINSLLYTELPNYLNEESIHGLPAPTVSTTLSLILADATILALSEMIERDLLKRKKQFSMKHPGGSIGNALSHLNDNVNQNGNGSGASSSVNLSNIMKKSFSSQYSTSSLLSLGRNNSITNGGIGPGAISIRKSISTDVKSNFSSLTSSDDEYDVFELKQDDDSKCTKSKSTTNNNTNNSNIDISLTNKIKSASVTQIKLIKNEEIWSLEIKDEIKLLQWITIFEYLIIDKKNLAIPCSTLKSLYTDYYHQVNLSNDSSKLDLWSRFHLNLISSFKEIDF